MEHDAALELGDTITPLPKLSNTPLVSNASMILAFESRTLVQNLAMRVSRFEFLRWKVFWPGKCCLTKKNGVTVHCRWTRVKMSGGAAKKASETGHLGLWWVEWAEFSDSITIFPNNVFDLSTPAGEHHAIPVNVPPTSRSWSLSTTCLRGLRTRVLQIQVPSH